MADDKPRYYHERGNSEEARPLFNVAESICENSRDQDLLWDIHSSQGAIATETNDAKGAIKHYKILKQMTDTRYPSPSKIDECMPLAIASNEIGVAYMMNESILDAKKSFEKARGFTERFVHRSKTAMTFFSLASANLGLTLWLRDEYEDANDVLEHAMRTRQKQFGDDDNESFV